MFPDNVNVAAPESHMLVTEELIVPATDGPYTFINPDTSLVTAGVQVPLTIQ